MIKFFGKIVNGQSLARAMMNHAFRSYTISGKVVDVGGGRSPDYYEYLQKGSDYSIEPVDASLSGIDFESDHLPQSDGIADTVICANVLEHIYNHAFLISEIRRIMKNGAYFIGFVPFLVNYHPDPHDYFRYTEEALKKMFETAGFQEIDVTVVGAGPFAVNFNNITLSLPLVVRMFVFPIYTIADWLVTTLRPGSRRRYPLGYVFSMRK
jgi:SAM-dependent methyltransferase